MQFLVEFNQSVFRVYNRGLHGDYHYCTFAFFIHIVYYHLQ